MCTKFLDPEVILSGNEEWIQLEEKWGKPIDLETDEEQPSKLRPVFSTLDLVKTTFDSSFLFKKVRRKVGRKLSKSGALDYKGFLEELQTKNPAKDFYYVNGQIISAVSVEEICKNIDEIFNSVEKLCSATSTTRKNAVPDSVRCSISVGSLSFDDTKSVKGKTDEEVEKYIDEAFEKFEHLSNMSINDDATRESVTTLVRKFSSILSSPSMNNCSPRRKRHCSNKFKELAEFWQHHAFNETNNKS